MQPQESPAGTDLQLPFADKGKEPQRVKSLAQGHPAGYKKGYRHPSPPGKTPQSLNKRIMINNPTGVRE